MVTPDNRPANGAVILLAFGFGKSRRSHCDRGAGCGDLGGKDCQRILQFLHRLRLTQQLGTGLVILRLRRRPGGSERLQPTLIRLGDLQQLLLDFQGRLVGRLAGQQFLDIRLRRSEIRFPLIHAKLVVAVVNLNEQVAGFHSVSGFQVGVNGLNLPGHFSNAVPGS